MSCFRGTASWFDTSKKRTHVQHDDMMCEKTGKKSLPFALFTVMRSRGLRSIAFPTPLRPLHPIPSSLSLLLLLLFPIALRNPPRIHKHRLRIRDEDQHEHDVANVELRLCEWCGVQMGEKYLRRIPQEENQEIDSENRDLGDGVELHGGIWSEEVASEVQGLAQNACARVIQHVSCVQPWSSRASLLLDRLYTFHHCPRSCIRQRAFPKLE